MRLTEHLDRSGGENSEESLERSPRRSERLAIGEWARCSASWVNASIQEMSRRRMGTLRGSSMACQQLRCIQLFLAVLPGTWTKNASDPCFAFLGCKVKAVGPRFALTAHSAQGMTLDDGVILDCGI